MTKAKAKKKTKAAKHEAEVIVEKPFAIALVKADGEYYVLVNRDNSVAGFDSVHAGLAFYEEKYERRHRSGYEQSMSACINYIFFQPAIVEFKGVEELREALGLGADPTLCTLSHVSGFMSGIRADREKAATIWDKAEKPILIRSTA